MLLRHKRSHKTERRNWRVAPTHCNHRKPMCGNEDPAWLKIIKNIKKKLDRKATKQEPRELLHQPQRPRLLRADIGLQVGRLGLPFLPRELQANALAPSKNDVPQPGVPGASLAQVTTANGSSRLWSTGRTPSLAHEPGSGAGGGGQGTMPAALGWRDHVPRQPVESRAPACSPDTTISRKAPTPKIPIGFHWLNTKTNPPFFARRE